MTTLAIMQPTFLPWLGYFALMDQADHFIFLDDVQFAKQSWQSRNRIKGPDGPVMLSLGVARKPSKPLIKDVKLADTGFEEKLQKTVHANLSKAPHYPVVARLLEQGFAQAEGSLSKLNRTLITNIATLTGLETRCSLASETAVAGTDKADRLLAFCHSVGASTYLSPVGSLDYLSQHNPFAQSDVTLIFQHFQHPTYPQSFGTFQSHMAAIDALAQVGTAGFLPLLRAGIKTPYSILDLERIQNEAL